MDDTRRPLRQFAADTARYQSVLAEIRRRGRVSREFDAARSRQSRGLAAELAETREDLAHMTLYATALANLLVQKGVFTQQEFVATARAIDLADGVEDGHITTPAPAAAAESAPKPPAAASMRRRRPR